MKNSFNKILKFFKENSNVLTFSKIHYYYKFSPVLIKNYYLIMSIVKHYLKKSKKYLREILYNE